MIKICSVYFKGLYNPDYVSKFYRSLKRNCTLPFEFICISDTKDIEADVILPYNHYGDVKKHWHKLKFFSPQFGNQKPGDDIIVMDIDQIIVNNIDDLIGWPVKENEFVTYGQWWSEGIKTNGGFYKFKSGSLKFVWDTFIENPEHYQLIAWKKGIVSAPYYGEQNFVNNEVRKQNVKFMTTPEEWTCKYTNDFEQNLRLNKLYSEKFNTDYMILDDYVNEKLKIVHFAGPYKTIHECDAKFIHNHWR